MSEMGMEQPLADSVEQHRSVRDSEESEQNEWPRDVPLGVDEADAAEQERLVDDDDEDYRL